MRHLLIPLLSLACAEAPVSSSELAPHDDDTAAPDEVVADDTAELDTGFEGDSGEVEPVEDPWDPLDEATSCGTPADAVFPSALEVHPDNPRWLADASGRAVWLRGLHHWNNLQDDPADWDLDMDYCAYVDFMAAHGQNHMRMWTWENTRGSDGPLASPMPFARTGPGTALDGRPKYDLTKPEPAYLERLRDRVLDAGKRGIYVTIMLFEGHSGTRTHSPEASRSAFRSHMLHRDNNIQGVDGDANGDGLGVEVHTMAIPDVTEAQRVYVEAVIGAVHDLPNVLFEVCNECEADAATWEWSNVVVDFVHHHEEAVYGSRHPVLFSNQMNPTWNAPMWESNAELVAPGHHWYTDWGDADGRKVVVLDTDHISPYEFDGHTSLQRTWAWKQFTRGYSVWFMLLDVTDTSARGEGWAPVGFDAAVDAMAHIGPLADRLDLATLVPRSDLCGHCLVGEDAAVVYFPEGGGVTLGLAAGPWSLAWIDTRTGATHSTDTVDGGSRVFTAPRAEMALVVER